MKEQTGLAELSEAVDASCSSQLEGNTGLEAAVNCENDPDMYSSANESLNSDDETHSNYSDNSVYHSCTEDSEEDSSGTEMHDTTCNPDESTSEIQLQGNAYSDSDEDNAVFSSDLDSSSDSDSEEDNSVFSLDSDSSSDSEEENSSDEEEEEEEDIDIYPTILILVIYTWLTNYEGRSPQDAFAWIVTQWFILNNTEWLLLFIGALIRLGLIELELEHEHEHEHAHEHEHVNVETLIASQTTMTYSSRGADTTTMCVICLNEFDENEVVIGLRCHHLYHPECISAWLQRHQTCPLCRSEVSASTDS